MLTRGHIELLKYSLACYQRQTYAHRELVVVAEAEAGEKVRAFIGAQEVLNATVFIAPPGLAIGDHRNLAAARARGAILVTWDDDDLSDPQRLDITVEVLRRSGAAAAVLSRLLIWWPKRKIAAISGRKVWEGTLLAWRSFVPIYPSLQRGEDSEGTNRIGTTHYVAHIDCPLLYVYAVTGRNTWEASHFEKFLSWADCVFEGDQFDELNGLLSDRLPVLEYASVLNDEGAVKILD
jgi:Glycosyl transferase family 2